MALTSLMIIQFVAGDEDKQILLIVHEEDCVAKAVEVDLTSENFACPSRSYRTGLPSRSTPCRVEGNASLNLLKSGK